MTRRTSERRFFLRPDRVVNEVFWYILGWAADKYNIGLIAACALANHLHAEIIDRDGCYPNFLRDFNAMMARCLNAYRGRWENFWNNAQTSMVLLPDADAQLRKAAYIHGNPVKDDLVQFAHSWPGATSVNAVSQGRSMTVKRPKHFFRAEAAQGLMPEEVVIRFVEPPAFSGRREEFVEQLEKCVAEIETEAEAKRAAEGKRVLGRKAILAQPWWASPDSHEPRRRLNPRVASRDKWARAEAILRNKDFHGRYREAMQRYRAGDTHVVFPPGTWLMVQLHGVPVAPT